MLKRIFVLSHYFYPFAGVGAIRHTYFVRHLAANGYSVTVFKAADKHYAASVSGEADFQSCELVGVDPPTDEPTEKEWNEAYRNAVDQAIKNDGTPDVVLFSANPFFYLELGPIFKRNHGVPYIIDFRDTFLNSKGLYEEGAPWEFKKMLWLMRLKFYDPQKQPILQADYVLTITEAEKRVLGKHYGPEVLEKVRVIFNGYNETALDEVLHQGAIPDDVPPLTVGIFGKFAYYVPEDVPKLKQALNMVAEQVPVELRLIGTAEPAFSNLHGLVDFTVEQTGFLSYEEGMLALSRCHVCILNNRSRNSHGTKIFDYVGLDKPIIAFIGEDSEIAALLKDQENTYVVQTPDQCYQALVEILTKNEFVLGNNEMKEKFSRKAQANNLVELLKKVCRTNSPVL